MPPAETSTTIMEEDDNSTQMEELIPRNYQSEMLQAVIQQNSIIYLPTGAGKTFIAFMTMKHYYPQIEKPFAAGGKRIVFAAPKVAIVTQQFNVLSRQTQFSVGLFNGNMNVDNWTKDMWEDQIDRHSVLVMGSQVLLDILDKNYLKMSDICLMVLDECHHATEKHNMKLIMENHYKKDHPNMPRVLGLTATLVKKNMPKHKLVDAVEELEKNLCSKIVRHYNDEDLKGLYANPNIRVLPVKGSQPTSDENLAYILGKLNDKQLLQTISTMGLATPTVRGISQHIQGLGKLVQKKNSVASDCSKVVLDVQHHLIDLGLFGGKLAIKYHTALLKVQKFTLSVTSQEHKMLELMLAHLDKIQKIAEELMASANGNYSQMAKYSANKVHGMFDILRSGLTAQSGLCGIVFVQRRVTAVVLFHLIKIAMELDKSLESLKPDFALGGSGSQSYGNREYAMINNKMKKSIDRFNAGLTNLVFSTDVLEEGIDVPRCNIVVRFDPIKTMCSFIQSKGRARDQAAIFHVIDVDNEFSTRQYTYLEMEKLLKTVHTKPENDAILELKKIPPYQTSFGSIATTDNSIRLIYRYCTSLSSGRFSCSDPHWYYKEVTETGPFTFSIILPVACPHKREITGPEMVNMKEAKGACALEAVKLLHSIGELDDHLFPKSRSEQSNELLQDKQLFKHWKKEEGDENVFAAGTKKRRREHDTCFPDCLTAVDPQPNENIFVHILRTVPNYQKLEGSANSRKAYLHDLISSNEEGFALLTSKPWPELCAFPVFANFGEICVSIQVNSFTVQLNPHQIQSVQKFHRILFEQLLQISHSFLEFDSNNSPSNYFLAPIRKKAGGYSMDWVLISSVDFQAPDVNMEETLCSTAATLLGAVVNPCHRNSACFDPANWNYVVTKVRTDLNPLSSFPEGKFRNYAEFFKAKYHMQVQNFEQPLIEVRPISDKLSMLSQGKDNSLSKQKAQKREGEMFIPELCRIAPLNYVWSSKMWLTATLLPTSLARIDRLLRANELRTSINASTNIGVENLPKGVCWEPMQITHFGDKYVHIKTDASGQTKSGPKGFSIRSPAKRKQLPEQKSLWYPEVEPIDLDYNLLTATDEDIINYARFAMKELDNKHTLNMQRNSYKQRDTSIAVEQIELLSRSTSNLGPQQHTIFTALTTSTANDSVDMERLETLGDSFLKLASSLYLFSSYGIAEGKLTEVKGKIVGNKNLFYCAMNRELATFMNCARFSPKLEWRPPCYSVPEAVKSAIALGELSSVAALKNVTVQPGGAYTLNLEDVPADAEMHQMLDKQIISDKCVSDCAEAIIGAYLLSCGPMAAASLMVWLEILPEEIKQVMVSPAASCIYEDNLGVGDSVIQAVNKNLHCTGQIESVLGYRFKDRSLLLQALTHSSCMTNRLTDCNQRLEFLGDAVLDFLITCYIYEQCENLSPGAMTDLRSALVNNVVFGSLTVRFGLHSHLLQNSPSLFQLVDTFVEYQQSNDFAITEEYLLALNENSCLNVASYVEVPKVLGDLWESLAGAVYLDSGKDLARTWAVFYPLMKKEIDAFSTNVPIQPVRMLYELVGKNKTSFQPVEKKEDAGCKDEVLKLVVDHPSGPITCYGQGRSKQQAKIASAKYAIKRINEIAV